MLELAIERLGTKIFKKISKDRPLTIGRNPENTIRLAEDSISRNHCRIEIIDGSIHIFDTSTNGTFINGKKTSDAKIHEGDLIRIGEYNLSIATKKSMPAQNTAIENISITNVSGYNPANQKLKHLKMEFSVSSPKLPTLKKTLYSGNILIGNHPSCDLDVTDSFVSKRHCRIVSDGRGLNLLDLSSTNGTFFDDVRISRVTIPQQGEFKIGETSISYKKIAGAELTRSEKKTQLGTMFGASKAMREVFALINQVAPTDAAVVITGETGTGKELCAREIHNHSRRRRGPFVALNCGAIPREIIESLLFGHERGAFTGAMERQLGLFEQANAGTIFLDEIGEMPSELQTRLLRVLETGTIRRIGGREEIPVDVRVIAATNRNLRRMVEEETFREDLFYRIYIFPIDLPPLRERKDEIPALARHLTGCLFSSGEEIELTGGAVKKLCEHTWPGNVRELKNALVRAAVQADGKSIDCRHIKLFSCGGPSGEGGEFAKNERAFLEAALAENDYNITKTAIRIKVARSSLQNKIKRLEIHMPKNP